MKLTLHFNPYFRTDHGCAFNNFVKWCNDNFLDLNIGKTKEVIIDFRKSGAEVNDKDIEIVEYYKYLGTVFDLQLKFETNTDTIVKCGQQRIHLLRKTELF